MPMFFVGNKPKTQFNLPKQQPIERKQINTPRNSGFHVTSPHPPFDISELKKQGKEVHLRKIHHHNVPHQHNHNNIYYDNKGLIPHPFVYDDYEDFARIGTASTTIEYTYEKPFNHEVIKPTQHEPVFMNQTEKCDCHVCSPRKYCSCHACKVPEHVLNKRKQDIAETIPQQQHIHHQIHHHPHGKLCTCSQCLNVNYSKLAIKKHVNDENEEFIDWHIPTDRSSKMFKKNY